MNQKKYKKLSSGLRVPFRSSYSWPASGISNYARLTNYRLVLAIITDNGRGNKMDTQNE